MSDNPEGLADFEPMEHPAYAARVWAYSDRLRAIQGRPPLRLPSDRKSQVERAMPCRTPAPSREG